MSEFVIDFYDMQHLNFNQASVYIDACFLLSFADLSDDRGEKVELALDKWRKENIKELVISNHVMGEVVHNLFKNCIRDTLFIMYSTGTNLNVLEVAS